MTEPLVDLSKHTGVQRLLTMLGQFDGLVAESEDSNNALLAIGNIVADARSELQRIVDDACKVDMDFADFRQKSAEKASADVANVWSELNELRVVHSAFVENDKVKDKTIERLTKERDKALAELDHANAHHDEHHAREDKLTESFDALKKTHSDLATVIFDGLKLMSIPVAPPLVDCVRNIVDTARKAHHLEQEVTALSKNNTLFATEITEAFELAGRRLSGLGVSPNGKILTDRIQVLFDLARDHGENRKAVEEKNAVLQKERDAAVSSIEKSKEKYETKLTTAGNRISEFYGVTRNLLALVKTKVTVADAYSAVTDAERLLAKKQVTL
jgi:hypothetical protein